MVLKLSKFFPSPTHSTYYVDLHLKIDFLAFLVFSQHCLWAYYTGKAIESALYIAIVYFVDS